MDESGSVFYSMAMVGGDFVGGMYEQPEDQRQAGIPPHWMIHMAVDDVDAIAARVPESGRHRWGAALRRLRRRAHEHH